MNQIEILIFIIISVSINSVAQIVWKKGAKPGKSIIKMILNKKVILGLGMYAVSALIWILILSQAPLSYAYPFISLGYILVAVLSKLVLKEEISAKRIIGMSLIILGVILVGASL